MKIAITGASGLVGSDLVRAFAHARHDTVRLVRTPSQTARDTILWNPDQGTIQAAKLEGIDAVVHLAGENLAGNRWTAAHKARIRSSRVGGTTLISQTLADLRQRPRVLISASAVGYYGSRDDAILDEKSPPGVGFLADVAKEWEAATQAAEQAGIRVAHLRFGMILSAKGGALPKMLTPFKLGLGGVIGSGNQFWSWIAIDDVVSVVQFCLEHTELNGPINAVAPQPVTNREFTKTLGAVLHRPTMFRVPAFVARLGFGEMAEEALLASCRAVPARLQTAGYPFKFPALHPALTALLQR